MDKHFATPRDVGNASQDEVARVLHRVLRTLDGRASFILRTEFEFASGRRGPLLMVGSLRNAWREYLRRNSGSPSFASGECEVHRIEGGRVLVDLCLDRGRTPNIVQMRALNEGLMRAAGAEARFVDALGAEPDAGTGAAGAPAAAPAAGADPEHVRAGHKALVASFNAFKQAPTAAGLEGLFSAISEWKSLRDRLPDPAAAAKASQQVDSLEKLLNEKGRAFVARASS